MDFKFLLVAHVIKWQSLGQVSLIIVLWDFRPKEMFAFFRTHNVFKLYNQMVYWRYNTLTLNFGMKIYLLSSQMLVPCVGFICFSQEVTK